MRQNIITDRVCLSGLYKRRFDGKKGDNYRPLAKSMPLSVNIF